MALLFPKYSNSLYQILSESYNNYKILQRVLILNPKWKLAATIEKKPCSLMKVEYYNLRRIVLDYEILKFRAMQRVTLDIVVSV